MAELTPEQKENLQKTVGDSETIRSFCKHPGFALYRKALEDRIADKKNTWLKGSDEEAKHARYKAQGLSEALDELKKFLVSGEAAKKLLTENAAENALTQPQAELKV